MGPIDFLIHLASFAAPALGVALLLVLAGRAVVPHRPGATAAWLQFAINSVAGAAVLGAGMWYFGRDGKMTTYAAMVAVMASGQWLLSRAWRR